MCGLTAAYASDLRLNELGVLRTLLQLSDFRGGYGAGEVSVNKKGEIHFIKDHFSAYDLVNTKSFNDRMKEDISLVIGHSRYPTKGKENRTNAHPHSTAKVIGVHNGTMQAVMEKPVTSTESDSKTLFEAVSNFGIEEVISKSPGAYALMWVDKEAKEFRILRNHERPLFFAKIKPFVSSKDNEFRSLFLSSEKRMLQFALDRHGLLNEAVLGEVITNKMICFPLCPEPGFLPEPTAVIIPECRRHYYSKSSEWYKDREWDSTTHSFIEHNENRMTWRDGQFYDVTPAGVEIPWSKQKTAASPVTGAGKNVVLFGSKADTAIPTPLEKEILRKQKLQFPDDAKVSLPDIGVETDFSDESILLKETSKGNWVALRVYQEYLESGCSWCSKPLSLHEARNKKTAPHFFSKAEFLCSDCQKSEDASYLVGLDYTKALQ